VVNDRSVRGASILGELRVSKFLLERLAGAKVTAFRPGRLSYPFSLPQALRATGYSYSSSITANTVLTHLPFQLSDGRADAALQPVWEFPVTIEDEAPPRLGDRIDAADKLIGEIAREHGVVVILIHPNITGHKLRFEQAITDRWRGRAWMGSIRDFGAWWTARDALATDVVDRGGRTVLVARAERDISDVSLVLPKARRQVRLGLKAGQTVEIDLS
jgi:peptidoglycan/xylan/chitin deacetylase (PgdA/CDA1 family)